MSRLTKYLLTNDIMVVNRCHEPHPPVHPNPPSQQKRTRRVRFEIRVHKSSKLRKKKYERTLTSCLASLWFPSK